MIFLKDVFNGLSIIFIKYLAPAHRLSWVNFVF